MSAKSARKIRRTAAKVGAQLGLQPAPLLLLNQKTGVIRLGRCEKALRQRIKKTLVQKRRAAANPVSHAVRDRLANQAREVARAANQTPAG